MIGRAFAAAVCGCDSARQWGLLADGRAEKTPPRSPKGVPNPGKQTDSEEEERREAGGAPTREESGESQPEQESPDPSSPEQDEESESGGSSDRDTDETPYGPPAPKDLPFENGNEREPD